MNYLLTYFVHLFNNTNWSKPLKEFFLSLPVGLIYWICIGTTLVLCLLFYLLISKKVSLAKPLVWFLMMVTNGVLVGIISISILHGRLNSTISRFAVGGFPKGLKDVDLIAQFWNFTVSFTAQVVLFSMLLFLLLSLLLKGLSSNARYVPFRWPN